MESKFYQSISKLKPGNGITILGKIEKLFDIREVSEPNRIKIKSQYESNCFHCKGKISEGDWIKWAMGSREVLHLGCESQYEKIHHQIREPNKVRDAILSDVTGKIKLTLWKNDTSLFSIDEKIEIRNGYVYNFKGELHISVGYYGTLLKISQTRGRNYYQEQRRQQEEQRRQQEEQRRQQEEQKQKSTSENNKRKSGLEKYYKILGLDSSADWKQVKAAHRRLAFKYHPDKNKSADAQSQFIKIQNAFEKLKEKHDSERGYK
tara:strand:+ start:2462 stop:3250 length:789 start_codon:yes stop_codon:yes gene_type:complete